MDLGLGQPMEHVLRAWLIAARLGEHVGLERNQRGSLYYMATLAWVGCVAATPEVRTWFGDDIAYRGDSYRTELAGLPMLGFMLRHVGAGGPPMHRLRLAANLVAMGSKALERGLMSHCLTTARMAERIGLGADVRDPLQHFFARWDGKGVPGGVGGEAIALSMRLFHLADTVEVFHRADGADAAVEVARDRRGSQVDPALVDAFCAVATEVLGGPTTEADWHARIAEDPSLQHSLSERELDTVLEAIGDFTDLRSPSRAGHSRGVADLVARAASHAGRPDAEIVAVRRAALLPHLRVHGVPASILAQAGPLSESESERIRMHAHHTQPMLARPPVLARLGAIASLAHERCDGSGYHRALVGPPIPAPGRLPPPPSAFPPPTS